MRVVLVPVAGRPECKRALTTAFDIAGRVGASVAGCHMRPHRYDDPRFAPGTGESEWRKRTTTTARAGAKAVFEEIAHRAGYPLARRARSEPCAMWDEKVGSPSKLMGIVGPLSDLIIVNRSAKEGGIAELFLNAALLESGRPVLLLPKSGTRKVGTNVCIGWNQTPEAARSVAAVTPLLAAADSVTIVTCGAEDRAGPKSTQLVQYLKHYGIKAERVHTPGRHIEEELAGACGDVGANLLVSGAYSKNRWREKILGGTTEWLVRKCKLPVLMQHG